jgi:hypothetical protein
LGVDKQTSESTIDPDDKAGPGVTSGKITLKTINSENENRAGKFTKRDIDALKISSKVSKATVLLNKLHKLEKKIALKLKQDEKEEMKAHKALEAPVNIKKQHKKELKRAYDMYVKDPTSVAVIPSI